MLGNLRPELRSTQRSIQLICCVESKHLEKYGFLGVLESFVKDLNNLADVRCSLILCRSSLKKPIDILLIMQEGNVIIMMCLLLLNFYTEVGRTVEVNGRIVHLRGTALVVLADTLAAHQLGGYKIGVGFSLRKCRHCMATFEDMQTKVCYKLLDTTW